MYVGTQALSETQTHLFHFHAYAGLFAKLVYVLFQGASGFPGIDGYNGPSVRLWRASLVSISFNRLCPGL